MMSLKPIPTPCNGPAIVPQRSRRSAARACSSARSASNHAQARTRASCASILAMPAAANVSAVKRPSRTPRADSRRVANADASVVTLRVRASIRLSAWQEPLQHSSRREHEGAIDEQSEQAEDDDADERVLG